MPYSLQDPIFIFQRANVLQGTAQRLALPACGRAWILPGSRKNSKPGKRLKNAQTPTCRVHALLGRHYGTFRESRLEIFIAC